MVRRGWQGLGYEGGSQEWRLQVQKGTRKLQHVCCDGKARSHVSLTAKVRPVSRGAHPLESPCCSVVCDVSLHMWRSKVTVIHSCNVNRSRPQ